MATEATSDGGTSPGAAPDRRVDRDRQYEFARSSRDLLRLVGGLILLLLGLVLATIFSDALLGFETDLVRVVRGLPEGLAVIVFGTIRVLSLLAALGLVAWLAWRRQWKLLGRLLLASVVALVLQAGVDRLISEAPVPSPAAIPPAAWATDISTSLGSGNVAVAVAIYMVARPLLTVPYRRLVIWVIALTTLHVLLAAEPAGRAGDAGAADRRHRPPNQSGPTSHAAQARGSSSNTSRLTTTMTNPIKRDARYRIGRVVGWDGNSRRA